MLDRYTSMQVFVQAASRGSLSAAGRELNMSPAMATKHVDSLETRLGTKLLHRTTRQLSLTDAGREYLQACQRILQDLEEAESEVSSQQHQAMGRLRLNAPLSFGTRFIAPLIPEFTHRYPLVEVDLGLSDTQQDLLKESWDLIVRIGHLADSDLRARRLGNCPIYSLSSAQRGGTWAFGQDGKIQVPVTGNLMSNNGDALLAAAVKGQGIIYQPNFIVSEALASGALVAFELDHPPLDLGGLHVLFAPDRRLPLKVRAMIDYLVEVFENSPCRPS